MPKINSQNAIVEIQAQREIGKKEKILPGGNMEKM